MTTDNAFKINSTLLTHQPTEHSWNNREAIGTDGNGRNIYPAPRAYELKWDFLDTAEFNEIYGYYALIGNTGTVSVDLPQYRSTTYQFHTYSGCILQEPTFEGYFENYYMNVRLLIVRVNGT